MPVSPGTLANVGKGAASVTRVFLDGVLSETFQLRAKEETEHSKGYVARISLIFAYYAKFSCMT